MARVIALAALAVLVCAGPASAQDSAEREARAHSERGMTAYHLAHYDEAIAEFEAAYELSRAPRLLYNIAQAHRLKGDCATALRVYVSYLGEEPAAPMRRQVEEQIAEMRACVARRDEHARAPSVSAPPRRATPAPARRTPRPERPAPSRGAS